MRRQSFSIATMMCIVAIAAVDICLFRQIDYGEENGEILGAASIFVLVNLVGFGLLRIIGSPGRVDRFLIGYEVSGLIVIFACLASFRIWPAPMEDLWLTARLPIEWFCQQFAPKWVYDCFDQDSWDQYPIYWKYPMLMIVLPFMTLPMTIVQLLFALIGSRLFLSIRNRRSGLSLGTHSVA